MKGHALQISGAAFITSGIRGKKASPVSKDVSGHLVVSTKEKGKEHGYE